MEHDSFQHLEACAGLDHIPIAKGVFDDLESVLAESAHLWYDYEEEKG